MFQLLALYSQRIADLETEIASLNEILDDMDELNEQLIDENADLREQLAKLTTPKDVAVNTPATDNVIEFGMAGLVGEK